MNEAIEKTEKRKKSLGKWFSEIAVYLLLLVTVGWGIDFWRVQSIVSGQAPELVTESVQGEQIDLLALSQEKPVLVYFWATWCVVCSSVSPSVAFMSDNYPVVTISLRSGEVARVSKYLQAKEYGFTVINDAKGDISKIWGVSITPTIFIVDKGEIKSVTTGFTSPLGMWLRLLMA